VQRPGLRLWILQLAGCAQCVLESVTPRIETAGQRQPGLGHLDELQRFSPALVLVRPREQVEDRAKVVESLFRGEASLREADEEAHRLLGPARQLR